MAHSIEATIRRDSFPVNIGTHTQLPDIDTPYAFNLGGLPEPPHKRQRIEIDPLLIAEPLSSPGQMLAPQMQTRMPLNDDAIDPSLEQAFPERHPHLPLASGRSVSPAPLDLSAEYLAMFDMEPGPPYQADNEQSNESAPRVQREQNSKLPEFHFDEETHRKICGDARMRMVSNFDMHIQQPLHLHSVP